MATQDWPTDRAFMGAVFRPGADVAKSGFTGFYTGNRETTSHLADRMTCEVMLPPCKSKTDAARREAFFMGLVSTGDWVRFGMLYRQQPLGTMSGSPTVNGAVAAGARSVALAGVLAAPNLLQHPQDFVGGSWVNSWGGSASISSNQGIAPDGTTTADAFQSMVGVSAVSQSVAVQLGKTYTFSITVYPNSAVPRATEVTLQIRDGSGGAATILASLLVSIPLGVYTRGALTWTSDRTGSVNVGTTLQIGSSAGVFVWGAQFEQASAATAYAGFATALAGDFIGVGGNLLQVAYAGATANDAGAMTVPLVYPAPKAISNGAAVTLVQPTSTWELDTDGLQLDYSAGNIQGGIAVPFRQVPV